MLELSAVQWSTLGTASRSPATELVEFSRYATVTRTDGSDHELALTADLFLGLDNWTSCHLDVWIVLQEQQDESDKKASS
jgi:hypothetical protein